MASGSSRCVSASELTRCVPVLELLCYYVVLVMGCRCVEGHPDRASGVLVHHEQPQLFWA